VRTEFSALAPINESVPDRADVRSGWNVGPEPFAKLFRRPGVRGALADRRTNLVDADGQRVAGLGSFDEDRPAMGLLYGIFNLSRTSPGLRI